MSCHETTHDSMREISTYYAIEPYGWGWECVRMKQPYFPDLPEGVQTTLDSFTLPQEVLITLNVLESCCNLPTCLSYLEENTRPTRTPSPSTSRYIHSAAGCHCLPRALLF